MYEYLKDPIQRTQYTLTPNQPICIYQIVTEFKRPFLLFFFCKSPSTGTYSLPLVQSGMSKLKDIQQHFNLLDYPLKYKGLLHGTLLFHYRNQESFMNIFDVYSNLADTQWLLPWEIVNTRHCDTVPVASSATTFFLKNPELLFLRTADSNNITIPSPRVGYVSTDNLADFKTHGVEYTSCDFLQGIPGYNIRLAIPNGNPTVGLATVRLATVGLATVRLALLDEEDDAKNMYDPDMQVISLSDYGYHAPLSVFFTDLLENESS